MIHLNKQKIKTCDRLFLLKGEYVAPEKIEGLNVLHSEFSAIGLVASHCLTSELK